MNYPWPWPPYGTFPGRYGKLGANETAVMADWMPGAPDEDTRIKTFQKWRHDELVQIGDHLWPLYNRQTRKWEGKATSFALDATEAEIDIMIRRFQDKNNPTIKTKPVSPLARPNIQPHLNHFEIEDQPRVYPSGGNLNTYDTTMTDREHAQAIQIIREAFSETKISGLFYTKTVLSRIRPKQAAMLVNRDEFKCEIARTGSHSSMMSGHCIQGIMIGCSIYERWLQYGQTVSPDRLQALQKYSTDWGDRRVYAGVHYPTDNICSWGLAVSLIPHIFQFDDKILAFAQSAVEQSFVQKVIQEEFPQHKELAAALHYLNTKVLHRHNLNV